VVDFPDHDMPVAAAHADREMEKLVYESRRRRPIDRDAPRGPGAVLRSGMPELVSDIPREAFLAAARDPEHRAMLERLTIRSYMCVPMLARGKILGAITLISSSRRYDAADLVLAQEIAQRAGQAVDNARLYREAQEAVKVRDEFLSIASHELRTPLTPLLLHVQALERATSSAGPIPRDRLIRSLSVAKRQVQRFTALIENLLDVSRIRGKRLHLNLDDTDFSAVVVDACGRFREEAQRVGSSLEVHVQPNVTGIWDRLRLEQIVTNLLSNALKYGPNQPVEIGLSADDDAARLTVRDHGIGVDDKDAERIFGRFERAVSLRSYGGLGLGLYIVRQIAGAHEGTVHVEPTPGGGATFVVVLPRRLRKGEVAS
jgi:signal transduction histidine kinase